jgi:hypothetical protein
MLSAGRIPRVTSLPDEHVPAVAEIRTALRDSLEFVQPERYQW